MDLPRSSHSFTAFRHAACGMRVPRHAVTHVTHARTGTNRETYTHTYNIHNTYIKHTTHTSSLFDRPAGYSKYVQRLKHPSLLVCVWTTGIEIVVPWSIARGPLKEERVLLAFPHRHNKLFVYALNGSRQGSNVGRVGLLLLLLLLC